MKVIVYSRPDGGVSVVNPAPKRVAKLMTGGMTEDQAISAIQAKSVPGDATNVEVMEQAQIPTSREFRNAWEKTGVGPPSINMSKARTIHADHIAIAKRKFARDLLEREMMGENITADKATLAALDLQAQIDNAANPNALSAIWPSVLDRFRRP